MNIAPLSYSIPDALAATGLRRTRLYQAIKDGALRTKKLGNRTVILRDDLQAFLSNLPDGGPAQVAA